MSLKERDVETEIDEQLKNKKWICDIKNPNRNVYKQSAKTKEQKKLLGRKSPDYVLYQEQTDVPLIVIEAKRPHTNLNNAMQQAIGYAEAIQSPMAFATDGIFTKTFHLPTKKSLVLNGEEVEDLIEHSLAVEYLRANEYSTFGERVIKSRDELICIFKSLNDSFRDAGVRSGIERTELFCNILFLKIISEMSEMDGTLTKPVEKPYLWKNFRRKKGIELLDFINKQAFDYFKSSYGGDVLSQIKLFKPEILNAVINKLDDLSLSETNRDIKGDAFEYFLRNYGGADTDFGEYFTPRHIVKTLVRLLNPQSGEKIYDPFCGTGGMLITSFKHVYDRMARNAKNIKQLKQKTVYGAELTSMFRVAKMNMILSGDGHSNVKQQDSYGSPQTKKYDVVITNIPFGKKAKTNYSGLYGYDTKSAEIIGVLHCLDALSDAEDARAGIIVPSGILFSKTNAYSALREQLVEKYELKSIVELHNYVFAPNTIVGSRILIIKKRKNRAQKVIWYFCVNNDGLSKDTARRSLQGSNDLDVLLSETDLQIKEKERLKRLNFSALDIVNVRVNRYNLVPAYYERKSVSVDKEIPVIRLGDAVEIICGERITKKGNQGTKYPVYGGGGVSFFTNRANHHDALVISRFGMSEKCVRYVKGDFWLLDSGFTIKSKTGNILQSFVEVLLLNMQLIIFSCGRGVAQKNIDFEQFKNIEIPVPSLDVQVETVAKINDKKREIKDAEEVIKRLKADIDKILTS